MGSYRLQDHGLLFVLSPEVCSESLVKLINTGRFPIHVYSKDCASTWVIRMGKLVCIVCSNSV